MARGGIKSEKSVERGGRWHPPAAPVVASYEVDPFGTRIAGGEELGGNGGAEIGEKMGEVIGDWGRFACEGCEI